MLFPTLVNIKNENATSAFSFFDVVFCCSSHLFLFLYTSAEHFVIAARFLYGEARQLVSALFSVVCVCMVGLL